MRIQLGVAAAAFIALSVPAYAQVGGGGNVFSGTGDAAAQNLPSTVGIGQQTGNGYNSWRRDQAPAYDGRSTYPGSFSYDRPYRRY